MIFLFEDFNYKKETLEDILGSSTEIEKLFNIQNDGQKINSVGYFYNSTKDFKYKDSDRSIFVLPKVFLKKNGGTEFSSTTFNLGNQQNVTPEQLIPTPNGISSANNNLLEHHKEFLQSLGLYIWAAISKYKHTKGNKACGVFTPDHAKIKSLRQGENNAHLIDIAIRMKEFYHRNKDLFVFISKTRHSAIHKVNWSRTISRKKPIVQKATTIYTDFMGTKKVFDLDDTLIVLYFSAMSYISKRFGILMPKTEFYKTLQEREVDHLMECSRGIRKLHSIKHKYFEDRLVDLYNIMVSFFEWGGRFRSNKTNAREYLLVHNFNNVFEAMIDFLISDQDSSTQGLKELDDAKRIDHLYQDKPLIFANNDNKKIWHIGDSKYYKDSGDIGDVSIAKQFTYARNIIQMEMDILFNAAKNDRKFNERKTLFEKIRYRDDLTDGYNITPNFFILGEYPQVNGIPKECNKNLFINHYITLEKSLSRVLWNNRNRHFANRLFDRDTLLLQAFNVNFLNVLHAYTSQKSSDAMRFRQKARKLFRDEFLKLLNDRYMFWEIYPKGISIEDFVSKYFRLLSGRIFAENGKDSEFLLLALERANIVETTPTSELNTTILNAIGKDSATMRITPHEIFRDPNTQEPRFFVQDNITYDATQRALRVPFNAFEREFILRKRKIPQSYTLGNTIYRLKGSITPHYEPTITDFNHIDYILLDCI